jgi:hypothetical protein
MSPKTTRRLVGGFVNKLPTSRMVTYEICGFRDQLDSDLSRSESDIVVDEGRTGCSGMTENKGYLSYVDFCCNEGQGAGIFNLYAILGFLRFPGKISEHNKRQRVDRILVEMPTMPRPGRSPS